MSNPLAGIDPNGVYQRLVTLGSEWADQQGAAAFLEETAKPLLSRLTLERMDGRGTRAQAETEALASDDYARHLAQMIEARRKANIARVRYQSAQVWAELLRSANANRRAELTLGHHTP